MELRRWCILLAGIAFTQSVDPEAISQSSLSVAGVQIRGCKECGDRALVRILLRNNEPVSAILESVLVAEQEVWRREKKGVDALPRVEWCEVISPRVPSGDQCVVLLSLRGVSGERDGDLRLKYSLGGQEHALSVPLGKGSAELRWRGIAFDAQTGYLWFGIEWKEETPSSVTSIELNGIECIQDVKGGAQALEAAESVVMGFPVPKTVMAGEDAILTVRSQDGDMAIAHVRIHDRFPIVGWEESPGGLGLDDDTILHPRNKDGMISYTLLADCNTGTHGEPWDVAELLRERDGVNRENHGARFGCTSICPLVLKRGFSFGQLSDVLLVHQLDSFSSEEECAGFLGENRVASLASRSSVPNLWFGNIRVEPSADVEQLKNRPPTFEELRYNVWEFIAYGAKGIVYSGSEEDLRGARVDAVNAELREYVPSLIYAIPIENRPIHEGRARMAVLQAALDELIVIVLNRTLTYSTEPPRPTMYELLHNVRVDVEIPPGLTLDADRGGTEPVDYDQDNGVCSFTLKRLERLYVTRIGLREREKAGRDE